MNDFDEMASWILSHILTEKGLAAELKKRFIPISKVKDMIALRERDPPISELGRTLNIQSICTLKFMLPEVVDAKEES